MNEVEATIQRISRRQALRTIGGGIGSVALGSLLANEAKATMAPHYAPQAKRVIYLFQSGGPSQIDLFEHKPAIRKFHGEDVFAHVEKAGRLTGFTNGHKIHPIIDTQYGFKQYGDCGSWVSELLPHMASISPFFSELNVPP